MMMMVSVKVLGKKNHTGEGSETTRPPLRLCKRSRFDFYKKQNCAQMMKLHKHQAFMQETAKFTRRCNRAAEVFWRFFLLQREKGGFYSSCILMMQFYAKRDVGGDDDVMMMM